MPTQDVIEWAERSLFECGRSLRGGGVSRADEAVASAEVLLAAMRELAGREGKP